AKRISASSPSLYYEGGFEQKMSRREAGLILGVSPSAGKAKIRTAHRRIIILNHPGKDGSPSVATKINEAKDMLESTVKN
ncbi:DnaJ subfamily C member 15, partial [Tauraco erythrolophus]